ncbi:NADH:ubiquinone oxidoreductase subunit N [Brevibacillus borstelensis AK1]|uniref:NADH-quinone oxidoreductase subunit N n=1 Tax=Brevibacillus borstelensis AK1 TaxID=1300222 RepID=M8DZ38_9BACL|nr:NADH-quinone oxidoreductase subunit NuoN [Brevibacillus borstelensis]EMT52306.1 NADH:ubiquinone oxidoreductase subunit N [Brevibacillus borstelensis AK1]
MDVKDIFSYDWSYLLPEFIILGFATALSLLDLFAGKRLGKSVIGWLTLAGVVLAAVFVFVNIGKLDEPYAYMADTIRIDDYGNAFKLLFLGGVAFTVLLSLSYMKQDEIRHGGEYYYLLLTGLLGAMVMASSADLITMFVGLELLSMSSYVLVGLRKHSLQSNESAFKYIVSGSISTAVTLFGMSYVYGLTGTTNIYEISVRLSEAAMSGYEFMVYAGFAFLAVGLAFKISAAPNHMWAPDVYQGAATPVTAFLAVVSKAAGFALVFRLLLIGFFNIQTDTRFFFDQGALYLAIIAGASMIIGNTMALRQTNVKRMMAYSGIAQAGYMLVAFAPPTILFFGEVTFFLFAYLLASFGAFAVIMVVARDQQTDDLKGFAGLYHRSPLMAVSMSIFLLSLAGIPVSAGFFGKFYIFMGAIAQQSYVLAAIMIATSVVSYYYYFGIIRQMYMRPGATEAPLSVPKTIGALVLILTLATVVFGAFPGLVTDFVQTHLNHGFNFGDMLPPNFQ